MTISREQAEAIIKARAAARNDLKEFARYVDIPGVPQENAADDKFDIVETDLARHHVLILDALQAMVDRKLVHDGKVVRRVMLMFPPGAAKSTYASVVFPAWYMGRYPHSEIIITGYGDPIAKRNGKRARQLASSPAFNAVYGSKLDPTMKAADDWRLENGSSYKAAGILSGITGFRCDGLISDDLTKGRKEADSETIRNDTYNAYTDDFRTRKKPDAWELMIGTRWHEDETMGRILPEGYNGESGFIECRDGNTWLVLCVAAQCERDDDPIGREVGEYLWPEWFTEDYWGDKKVNARSWGSLYQQRPAPDEGIVFLKEYFRRYDELPKERNHYISFDPAVTDGEQGDSTAILVWAVDSDGRIYLIDEYVAKVTMDIWITQLMRWIKLYKPLKVVSESGVIRRAAEPFILRAMRNTGCFATFEWMTRHADKTAMARSAEAMYASGQIYHPKTTVGDNVENELLKFPTSKDDHRVDAVANLCLHLENVWEAAPPKTRVTKQPTFGDDKIPIKRLMPKRFPNKRSRYAHRK